LHLVFPTTDSLALRLAKLCLENKANIEAISFRAMGTNLKDNLSIKSAEVFYKNLLTNFPSCKIRIGFETFSYKSELLESGIPSDKICWAPAPSFYRQKRENIESKTLVLGFLGSARPNKGFENIPRLLQAMSDSGFSFQVIVQKAVYPWPAYTSTLQILSKWEGLIEFIPENISQNALEDLIAKVNVLVMPYRKEDYKIAGSGLLFIASDYSTPILSTKGVAFEWDIVTYSLGSTYSSESEFIDELTEICNSEMTFDFSGYNHNRNLAVREFLLF
jgi:hypothetical protein